MKICFPLILSLLVLTVKGYAEADPGPVAIKGSQADSCQLAPNFEQPAWSCYNPNWSTTDSIMQHLKYALFLGGHDGEQAILKSVHRVIVWATDDLLVTNPQAANRVLWSLKCKYISYYDAVEALVDWNYFDPATLRPSVQYPGFKSSTSGNSQFYPYLRRDMDYRTESCDLPQDFDLVYLYLSV